MKEISGFGLPKQGHAIVKRLIELEQEAIEALQDTIPATGHTGDSEALEHRLEHMIMRKQEQVDTLLRAQRGLAGTEAERQEPDAEHQHELDPHAGERPGDRLDRPRTAAPPRALSTAGTTNSGAEHGGGLPDLPAVEVDALDERDHRGGPERGQDERSEQPGQPAPPRIPRAPPPSSCSRSLQAVRPEREHRSAATTAAANSPWVSRSAAELNDSSNA